MTSLSSLTCRPSTHQRNRDTGGMRHQKREKWLLEFQSWRRRRSSCLSSGMSSQAAVSYWTLFFFSPPPKLPGFSDDLRTSQFFFAYFLYRTHTISLSYGALILPSSGWISPTIYVMRGIKVQSNRLIVQRTSWRRKEYCESTFSFDDEAQRILRRSASA